MSDARTSAVVEAARSAATNPILGTWRLASCSTMRAGEVELPLGTMPSGSLCYERDGRMAVHLCKGPGATGDGSMPDFTAYCGRYTLDLSARTVTHHIEAGSLPQLARTDQLRHVQLGDDWLVLSAQGARGETRLEWRRMDDTRLEPDALPPGFVPIEAAGPFPGIAYIKDRDGDAPVVGTFVAADHCNCEGFANAGVLLDFTQLALTTAVSGSVLNLSANFLLPARPGDWIEARILTRSCSPGVIFADAVTTSGGRDLLRVSGLFKPFGRDA